MYTVPQYIDHNKIFIVQRSEIEGRLDPHYNMPEYSELFCVLNSLPCRLSSLKEESEAIFSGITPKSGGEAYTSEANGVPFVRSGDFTDTNLIDFSKLLYLKTDVHNGKMSASQLKRMISLLRLWAQQLEKLAYIVMIEKQISTKQSVTFD